MSDPATTSKFPLAYSIGRPKSNLEVKIISLLNERKFTLEEAATLGIILRVLSVETLQDEEKVRSAFGSLVVDVIKEQSLL